MKNQNKQTKTVFVAYVDGNVRYVFSSWYKANKYRNSFTEKSKEFVKVEKREVC